VWLVELAPLADPMLVPQAVATALAVREAPGRALTDSLKDYLRARSLLLILDNCEHLIGACAQLADGLLRACPALRVLASSREALGIPGETAWRVPSLAVPDRLPAAGTETLAGNESVRLFVERATAALPTFALADRNAPAVAQICRCLDGMPLAIELAAALVRALLVEQIAARLDDRFRLLTGGSRTALPRQQTLRATVGWSHDLLGAPERVLLRRLSVFAGGWALEAAEAVTADDGPTPPEREGEGEGASLPQPSGVPAGDVLGLLLGLVDRSLVQVEEAEGAACYRLLETIRQYAREKLLETEEAERTRDRHLDYYLKLAVEADPKLRGPEQLAWLAWLEAEHDNLRAALAWGAGPGGPGTACAWRRRWACSGAGAAIGARGAPGWRGHSAVRGATPPPRCAPGPSTTWGWSPSSRGTSPPPNRRWRRASRSTARWTNVPAWPCRSAPWRRY
jgi:non-specific serine/threonine protein kinase